MLASGTRHLPPWGRCREATRGAIRTPRSPTLTVAHRRKGEGRRQTTTFYLIVRRVEALGSFLDTEDGKNLLAGTKRAANILATEEKKGTAIAEAVDPALFRDAGGESAVRRGESGREASRRSDSK